MNSGGLNVIYFYLLYMGALRIWENVETDCNRESDYGNLKGQAVEIRAGIS